MKSSLVRKTFDNITTLIIAFENFENFILKKNKKLEKYTNKFLHTKNIFLEKSEYDFISTKSLIKFDSEILKTDRLRISEDRCDSIENINTSRYENFNSQNIPEKNQITEQEKKHENEENMENTNANLNNSQEIFEENEINLEEFFSLCILNSKNLENEFINSDANIFTSENVIFPRIKRIQRQNFRKKNSNNFLEINNEIKKMNQIEEFTEYPIKFLTLENKKKEIKKIRIKGLSSNILEHVNIYSSRNIGMKNKSFEKDKEFPENKINNIRYTENNYVNDKEILIKKYQNFYKSDSNLFSLRKNLSKKKDEKTKF